MLSCLNCILLGRQSVGIITHWSESIKETQKNWIGRSEGAEIKFHLSPDSFPCEEEQRERFLTVFTTRADTIFGVTFMVLAPESEYVDKLTTERQKQEIAQYIERTKRRTERERPQYPRRTGF